MSIIFICGIHGVGKSTLCQQIKEKLNFECFSASSLIKEYNKNLIQKNKIVNNIDKNQEVLVQAVLLKKQEYSKFILDGHVTLLTKYGIEKIPFSIFEQLSMNMFICITAPVDIIYERRINRDDIMISKEKIFEHQQQEIIYAKELSNNLKIPFYEIQYDSIFQLIEIIKQNY